MLRNPDGSEAFMTIDGREVPICGNEGFDQEPCDDGWFMSLYEEPKPYWPPPPPPPPPTPSPPPPGPSPVMLYILNIYIQ